MKKSPNNSRYLRITTQVFWRFPVSYTKKEGKKICSYFPKEHQRAALKETEECVLKMFSWLSSESTPTRINRNEYKQRAESLCNRLTSLKKQLDLMREKNSYLWNELAGKFYKCYQINLGEFGEMVISLKAICNTIKLSDKRGWQNEAKHDAFRNLINIYEKHTGKKATRKVGYNTGIDYSECYGYINDSIRLIIAHANKILEETKREKIPLTHFGFENIYKEETSMVKTSPK